MQFLLTAPGIYNARLAKALENIGFATIAFPAIETIIATDINAASHFGQLEKFDYIILPSRNAIISFVENAGKYDISHCLLQKMKYITIGKDSLLLEKYGLKNALEASEPSTKGIYKAIKNTGKANLNFLLIAPKVDIIPEPDIIPNLIKDLSTIGKVTKINGYITKPVQNPDTEILDKLKNNEINNIIFTSGGEIEALLYLCNDKSCLENKKLICFGPYTASTLKKHKLIPYYTGKNFSSFDAFAQELKKFFLKK